VGVGEKYVEGDATEHDLSNARDHFATLMNYTAPYDNDFCARFAAMLCVETKDKPSDIAMWVADYIQDEFRQKMSKAVPWSHSGWSSRRRHSATL
jgi:hypothetical protein